MRRNNAHSFFRAAARLIAAALAGCLFSGCVSARVSSARTAFYSGNLAAAEETLAALPENEKDSIMYLMERGTVRQAMGRNEESTADWLKAVQQDDVLQTRSATETAASFVVNDKTIAFRGAPFERTLVHAFLAKNFLARGMWADAGVEARNIIKDLEDLNGYPDIAYCRYIAGFCLELMRDPSNAALQYRNASALVTNLALRVDDRTGAVLPLRERGEEKKTPKPPDGFTHELVCFVLMGRSPSGSQSVSGVFAPRVAPFATIHCRGTLLGRSYPLSSVADLINATKARTAVLQAAKDVSRVLIKEKITQEVRKKDDALGLITGIILFALESPDTRRWETLPMWFEVARVPCPPDLASFDVVFHAPSGKPVGTIAVSEPIVRNGSIFVSFCRNLPRPPPAQTGSGPDPEKKNGEKRQNEEK